MADVRFNPQMGPYRAIYTKVWDDEVFITLTAIEKLTFLFILTGPHTTSVPGLYPVRAGQIAGALDLTRDDVDLAMANLQRAGLIDFDHAVVITPKWTRYHRPGNANITKNWATVVGRLPKTRVLCDWIEALDQWFQEECPARRKEICNFPNCKDMENAPERQGVMPSKQGEGEGEEEGERHSESSGTLESSSPKDQQVATQASQPPLLDVLVQKGKIWDEMIKKRDAEWVAKWGNPPGSFTLLAEEFRLTCQRHYEYERGGGNMTPHKLDEFASRTKRFDVDVVAHAMIVYVDAVAGRKDYRYAIGVARRFDRLSEQEQEQDQRRHAKAHGSDGVIARIHEAQGV